MKKNLQPYIISVFLFAVAFGCHSSKDTAAVGGPASQVMPWALYFDRGPCYGQCPVYAFYLLSDNNGLIEVKANLLDPGWYYADLDQESVHEILTDIEPEEWWYDDFAGEPEISDLPHSILLYKHKDGMRWSSVENKVSDPVADVHQKLGHMIQEARWVATDKRPLEPKVSEPLDVIVQLHEGVDIQAWMKKYDRFGIHLKKRIAPKLQYYVVTKTPAMGSSYNFLVSIKNDQDVVDAQWDRPVSPRGQH